MDAGGPGRRDSVAVSEVPPEAVEPLGWSALFARRVPLMLDFGSGMGEDTVAMADPGPTSTPRRSSRMSTQDSRRARHIGPTRGSSTGPGRPGGTCTISCSGGSPETEDRHEPG